MLLFFHLISVTSARPVRLGLLALSFLGFSLLNFGRSFSIISVLSFFFRFILTVEFLTFFYESSRILFSLKIIVNQKYNTITLK